MASQSHQLHFVLFPLMAQGHMIPMFDIAKMLAHHGVIVTIVTTQLNAKRVAIPLARAAESGLQIKSVEIPFPCQEAGLPNEMENFDMLPSLGLGYELFMAANMLREPVERLFEVLTPRPSCIISDMCLPYTSDVATKFGIPRISFNGFSCFCTLCLHNIQINKILESVNSESELFVVPGLPDHIEMATNQLPYVMLDVKDFSAQVSGAEMLRYGFIINSFEELEPAYVQEYKRATGASNKPFIWVTRGGEKSRELENWFEENGFKERTKGRGLIIQGWAPQVAILSHSAIGSFLTHCGWNSVLEGISAGLPMVTWPLFGDQFCNEKLVVEVLKIGVRVGSEVTIRWGEEEKFGVLVKKEQVKNAVNSLMNDGEESEERRRIVQELRKMAYKAVEEEGSSYLSMKLLIEDIRKHTFFK
ncbi:hypothetical protein H0E87_021461 [Populus deltoides]|uniref:Glycosyltransferase n=1 Tax=Populus deltoides TaxID=3696 RepID=A0A8T2XHM0_POPDE|nr:hypothetical protein H0E87_021461 [Populus deltoides]